MYIGYFGIGHLLEIQIYTTYSMPQYTEKTHECNQSPILIPKLLEQTSILRISLNLITSTLLIF